MLTPDFHNPPLSENYCDLTGPSAGETPIDGGRTLPNVTLPPQIPGCPPELNLIISQNIDLHGRMFEIMERHTAAETKLAQDRQDLLDQQIAIGKSHRWTFDNKDWLKGASPDGEVSDPDDYEWYATAEELHPDADEDYWYGD